MRIFVFRHGQTTSDIEDRYGGDYDDHLTDLGISQVKKLSEEIKDFGIEVLFISPRIRTDETSKILSEKLGAPVEKIEGFKERNQYGILTGMKKDEAKERYPAMVEAVKDRFATIEGAEAYPVFRKRVIAAFKKAAESGHKTVGIVTHGGPIRRILGDIIGVEKSWQVADCGWLEIEFKDGKASLVRTSGIKEDQ